MAIEVVPQNLPEIVLHAKPRSFCAGVDRAIRIADATQAVHMEPVYLYHEPVHNQHVADHFRQNGSVIVDDIEYVPDGSIVVYSAHGVSPEVKARAEEKNLRAKDATCPLVDKGHREIRRYVAEGRDIIIIGSDEKHDEIVGLLGEARGRARLVKRVEDLDRLGGINTERLALVTQTTLSVDDTRELVAATRERFPAIVVPKKEDICYATQNRQSGVKRMVEMGAETILVLGSQNSSNSTRLKEVSLSNGARGYLFDDISIFDPNWIRGSKIIGVTAGASTPEERVEELFEYFMGLGIRQIMEVQVAREDFSFK